MGLALYYQKKGLAFGSPEAEQINSDVHRFIKEEAVKASLLLAYKFGYPEWCQETKRRNSHCLAIAPTRTNSIISGAFSAGVEPIDNNYFVAKEAKTSYVRKNPILDTLIKSKFQDEEQRETIWDSILTHKGSIQHLQQIFTKKEREIFKTAREIDAKSILRQARDRVPYICQGQSINLYVDPEISNEELWEVHLSAWDAGVKSLYYLKSSSLLVKKEAINDPDIVIITKDDCPWCHKLKEELTEPYKEITLEMAKAEGIWVTEWRTVPQIFIRGVRIGGYEEYINSKGESSIIEDGSSCPTCEG